MAKFQISCPGEPPVTLQVDGSISFKTSHYVQHSSDVVDYFSNCMKVPDVHRYTILWPENAGAPCLRPHTERGSGFEDSAFLDRAPELSESDRVVLLLLESPHIKEYKCDCSGRLRPVAPAQGNTGTRIKEHLATVLKNGLCRDLCDGAKVVIVNPVRYQASLGSILMESMERKDRLTVKEAVWAVLWNIEAVREDFWTRLRDYNPDIVIDACTSGSSKLLAYDMKAHVAISVAAQCSKTMLYATTHPSSWNDARNHWLKRVRF